MSFTPVKGSTLLIPSGPNALQGGMHLFIVMNDACPSNQHLLVNTSSIKEGQFFDPACVLQEGEHPVFSGEGYIEYGRARLDHTNHIIKLVEQGYFLPKETVLQVVYDKIFSGFKTSEFVPRYIQEYFDEFIDN